MTLNTQQIRDKFAPAPSSVVGLLCDEIDALRGQIDTLAGHLAQHKAQADKAAFTVSTAAPDADPAQLAAIDAAGRMAGELVERFTPKLDQMRDELERATDRLRGFVADLDGFDVRAGNAPTMLPAVRARWATAQKAYALDRLGHDDIARPWHTAELVNFV